MIRTHIRTHVSITFANPHLTCDQCKQPVPAWHNPDRCGCGEGGWQNLPCGHQAGATSVCPSWGPVDGCTCQQALGHVPHAPASAEPVTAAHVCTDPAGHHPAPPPLVAPLHPLTDPTNQKARSRWAT